jgi:hypothetical protein
MKSSREGLKYCKKTLKKRYYGSSFILFFLREGIQKQNENENQLHLKKSKFILQKTKILIPQQEELELQKYIGKRGGEPLCETRRISWWNLHGTCTNRTLTQVTIALCINIYVVPSTTLP